MGVMIESHLNEGKQSMPAEGPAGYVFLLSTSTSDVDSPTMTASSTASPSQTRVLRGKDRQRHCWMTCEPVSRHDEHGSRRPGSSSRCVLYYNCRVWMNRGMDCTYGKLGGRKRQRFLQSGPRVMTSVPCRVHAIEPDMPFPRARLSDCCHKPCTHISRALPSATSLRMRQISRSQRMKRESTLTSRCRYGLTGLLWL